MMLYVGCIFPAVRLAVDLAMTLSEAGVQLIKAHFPR
jgi:hypothetical protein